MQSSFVFEGAGCDCEPGGRNQLPSLWQSLIPTQIQTCPKLEMLTCLWGVKFQIWPLWDPFLVPVSNCLLGKPYHRACVHEQLFTMWTNKDDHNSNIATYMGGCQPMKFFSLKLFFCWFTFSIFFNMYILNSN